MSSDNLILVPTSWIPQYCLDLLRYLFRLKINSLENAEGEVGGVYSLQKKLEDVYNQIVYIISQNKYFNFIFEIYVDGELDPLNKRLTFNSVSEFDKARVLAIVIKEDFSDFELHRLSDSHKDIYVKIRSYGQSI